MTFPGGFGMEAGGLFAWSCRRESFSMWCNTSITSREAT